jgi:hypothetical protein
MNVVKKTLFIETLLSAIGLVSFNLLAQPISCAVYTEGEHLLRRYLALLKMQSFKMEGIMSEKKC